MRVVIVGASGNVGSALLRRLADEPVVTSLVGVAHRVPRSDGSSTVVPPFGAAEWVRCDLTDPAEVVAAALQEAFAGADAVVHLAWAIQPSHSRGRLRQINVEGTRRVATAARGAGVGHLVVASSVGAYAAAAGDHPRTEDWSTDGIPTSDYSRDKVAVERFLDAFEEQAPEVVVSRVRSALVFQQEAASEIARYFLGQPATAAVRRLDPFPVLPWPTGLTLQAVHADDLAEAYAAILVGRHPGAFNVAAPDVLTGQDVADVVSAGRLREVSPRLARAAVAAGWRLRAVPVGEGWLDLALGVPVLDSSRARELLRWSPSVTGRAALRELVDGIRARRGTQSPPLLPA